jgi:PAS domain-containing protein
MPTQRYSIEMHQDGRSWFENMYWSATNTPVHDADGKLICVSHTTIDITAQVLAAQALQLSRQEAIGSAQTAEAERANLEAVLFVAPVGILVVDRDGKVLQRNSAHVGLFGDDLPGHRERVELRDWHGWFVDGDRAGEQLAPENWPLRQALDGHAVEHCFLRVEAFDSGAIRTMLISSSPILNQQGEIVGVVAVSMDIEERVRAEEALREADRRKMNSWRC